MHIHLAERRIAGSLAVEVVPDKRAPPVAEHPERLGIPVILKAFSCEKNRGYDPLLKHTLDKLAEPCVRFLCLVLVQDRIYGRQLLHMGACHLVYRDKGGLAASQPRLQTPEHKRLDLVPVTAEQRSVILPQLLGLVKEVITEAFFIILYKNVLLFHSHPHRDSAEHLGQLLRQLRHAEHNPADLRKLLQGQLDKLGQQLHRIIGLLPAVDLLTRQASLQKPGHHKAFLDRDQALCFLSIGPGIPKSSDQQRDLIIVGIHFQRLRL